MQKDYLFNWLIDIFIYLREKDIHWKKKFNCIKEILAYEIFICREWNNLFNSMIYYIRLITMSMKFSEIEWIKILFKPPTRVCLVKRLNNTIT